MLATKNGGSAGGLRKATRNDLDRLFEIRNSVSENRLDDPYDTFVDIGGQIIDNGLCWVWDELGLLQGFAAYDPQTAYIEVLYVDAAAHKRGIGTALLQQCCVDLRQLGHDAATLSTTTSTNAEAFYRRRGWKEFGVDKVGDLLFKKSLK